MSGEARCPVCGRPAGPTTPEAACGGCGWVLYTPLRAGAITADIRRDFDTQLRAARHRQAARDARALDTALRTVIQELSRVPHPGHRHWRRSGHRDDGLSRPRRFPAGDRQRRCRLDQRSTDTARRRAGAVLPAGTRDRRTRRRQYRQAAARRNAVGDDRVMVICRPAGGPVLEAAATALATRTRAQLLRLSGASDTSVPQELASLAAKAPLRRPYRLMTVAVDSRTGAVALRPHQLFAIGDGPGTEASLTLRRMPGDVSGTTLAIFADTGSNSRGADGAAEDPLALYSIALPPGRAAPRRAVLDGPGRVRIVEPARGPVPGHLGPGMQRDTQPGDHRGRPRRPGLRRRLVGDQRCRAAAESTGP